MEYIPNFFYLSNGQLNWDAINTIFNSVLLLALACITWWYASQVNKQTKLMNKEIKRGIVLDYIQNFLTPSSEYLNNEILSIKDNDFHFVGNNGKSKIAVIKKFSDERPSFAKNDVFKKYPDLKNLFSEHDKFIDELIEIYEKIKETLENTIQIDCLKDLVEQFNNSKIEEANKLKGDAINNPIKHFMEYLINYEYYKKHGSSGDFTLKFLKEFDVKIINCIKTDLNELHEPKEMKLTQLIKKDGEILESAEEIIKVYRQEYYLSENEIAPN